MGRMLKRGKRQASRQSAAAEAHDFYVTLRPPKDAPDERKAKDEAIARFLAEKKAKGGA